MKANLKGLGGIKQFFVAHGEKLGIVLVAICTLMMIYGALGRESLPSEKEASQLNQKITLARQNMDGFTWEKVVADFPENFRTYKPLAQIGNRKVEVDPYLASDWKRPWDAPVVPPTVLRADPVLLDAQDVEANGGSGLLAFVDPEVRRRKILEEQKKAQELAKKQQQEQEKLNEDQGRGGRARGGREGDPYGSTVFDPEHPKRRPVVGMVRPGGVPLQDYEEVRVAHWAVVLAKVPIKEQLKLYRDAFENARDHNPQADIPQYLGYFVERAEIRASEAEKDLKWEPVYVYNGRGERIGSDPVVTSKVLFGKEESMADSAVVKQAVTTKWVSQMPEIVDPRYLEGGALAFPLPPLVGRDWGAEVTHSDVPLAVDAVPEKETKPTELKSAEEAEDSGDPFAGGATPGGALGGRPSMMGSERGYGGGPMGGPMGGRGGMGEGRGGGYGGMMGGMGRGPGGFGGMGRGEGGYGGGFGGEGRGYAGSGTGGFDANGEPQAPHWLLRFFDFSVEPGKKYKYRVRLAMLDPNQSFGGRIVNMDALDPDAMARVKKVKAASKSRTTPVLMTAWSKPSRTVTVPLAGSVNVASAKPASDQFNGEPKTTLLVQSFGTDKKNNAIEAAKEKDFQRGSVANMVEDTEVLIDQGRAIDPYKAFRFQTDITVADIRGGERLTRKDSRPARVLLMGPAGQLFVQDEISDSEIVETHRATFAKEPPGGATGFPGEGGYGGRGGPGGYGGEGRGR